MAELIVPKSSIAFAVQALAVGMGDADAEWTGIYVADRKPDTTSGASLPSAFIRVTRSSGGMLNRVTDRATLLVECWHDSARGEELALAAIAVLTRAAGQRQRFAGAFVRGIDNIQGPTDFPDPLTPSHDRFQFTADLLVSTN